MTNEERIYKLCEYIIDLINEFVRYGKGADLNRVKDKIISIKEGINNS